MGSVVGMDIASPAKVRVFQIQSSKTRKPSTSNPAGPHWAEQLFGGLLFSSAAGLAIVDRDFKYRFINPALAAMNGLPPKEHIGRTVREVLGDFADGLEPNFLQVLSTGAPLLNVEMWASTLPNRTEPGKWIEDYFPITDSKNNVTHIAIVVVEASQSGMDQFRERPSSASPAKPSFVNNRIQVFRSWKEIASYASASVRTAQRWERDFELPVRRLRTKRGTTVMAFKSDMDRWLAAAAELPDRILREGHTQMPLDSPALWRARIDSGHLQGSTHPSQLLRSWKEIARYLAASTRSVQRWEREMKLPVLRVGMKSRAAVVAFKSDLDEWLRSKGAELI